MQTCAGIGMRKETISVIGWIEWSESDKTTVRNGAPEVSGVRLPGALIRSFCSE